MAKDGQLLLSQTGLPVRIEQIQLEQVGFLQPIGSELELTSLFKDTAKTTFDARRRVSSIDLNRAGTGLMEIVSKPDMR